MKIINIFENTIYKEIHTFRDTINTIYKEIHTFRDTIGTLSKISVEPLFRVFCDGHIGHKKTYKLLTCRFLYCYCLFLSRPFSGETGIRTPGTSQYNGFQDRRNRPLCHLSKLLLRSTSFQKRCKGTLLF